MGCIVPEKEEKLKSKLCTERYGGCVCTINQKVYTRDSTFSVSKILHNLRLDDIIPSTPPALVMATIEGALHTGKHISFKILSNTDRNVRARLGRLAIRGRKDLETPCFLALTSRGVVPHVTPDVLAAHTQIGGVHMALEDCKLEFLCYMLLILIRF